MTIADQQNTNTALPLDSLSIKGYRTFKNLTIPKLGRVNLITGKNNVGKSALLEAIALYASLAAPVTMQRLLTSRDELLIERMENRGFRTGTTIQFYRSLDQAIRHLFFGRPIIDSNQDPISVGPIDHEVSINAIWYDEIVPGNSEDGLRNLMPVYGDNINLSAAPALYVVVHHGHTTPVRRYSAERLLFKDLGRDKVLRHSEYIISCGLSDELIAQLWDSVVATINEDTVIEALRILNPQLTRIVFVADDGTSRRVPLVRLSADVRIPLRSLGEGMSRLFGIVLALTTLGAGGILLIDEVENGLHYSILSDVWKLIFSVAERANVQVFATTHSWECIEAFQTAASDSKAEGALIRLQNKNGDITATVFDEHELEIVTRDQLEVR